MFRRGAQPYAAAVAAATAALLATACGSGGGGNVAASAGATASRVVAVVAAENVWGDIVRQIGGRHVSVTSIISDPNTDPHQYESDVQNAVAVARARMIVENGLGYDDFMAKLLAAGPPARRSVLSIRQVLSVTGADPNPHLWYDIAAVPRVAQAIATRLSRLDPPDATFFHARAITFDASLRPILDVIAKIKARYAGTAVAYTERVPGYLVAAAGLVVGVPAGFARAIEDGSDPSPADTAAFDRAISTKSIKVLLYNLQVTEAQTSQLTQLAASSGIPIVGVTETLPTRDGSFQTWQLRQARQLLTALGG